MIASSYCSTCVRVTNWQDGWCCECCGTTMRGECGHAVVAAPIFGTTRYSGPCGECKRHVYARPEIVEVTL